MLILKILVGVAVGLGYGALIGGSLLLVGFVAGDPPVDMMIDYRAILTFLTVLATIICGSAGAIVGLLVTLFRADKIRAALIGFSVGLVVLAGIVFKIWSQFKSERSVMNSWSDVSFSFPVFLVLFIMLPVALAVTGVTAVKMSDKFVGPYRER